MPSVTAIIMSTVLPIRPQPRRRRFLPRILISIANDGDKIRLSIHDGDLLTGSLVQPGFATSVHPDWSALPPLEQPKARIKEQAL